MTAGPSTTRVGQRALVTGANRGLGLETCRQLIGQGWRVLLTARREEEARAAAAGLGREADRVEPAGLDVTDAGAVSALAERLRREGARLDAMVSNGAVYHDVLDATTALESVEVNVRGPLRLVDAFAPLLRDGARVVMVSSGMGELGGLPEAWRRRFEAPLDRAKLLALLDTFVAEAAAGGGGAGGALPYRVTKCALNVATRLLAAELAPRGIRVNAVCPGWVRTRMGGASAPRDVETGASGIVWAASLPAGGPTGGFFRDGQPIGC